VLVDRLSLFPILTRFHFRYDFDGAVGAVHLTYSATGASMLIILVVHKYNLTLKALEHFKSLPVLGVLLGYNSAGVKKVGVGNPQAY